jgi:hypothetical protein
MNALAATGWFVVALLGAPALIATGLWLLGLHLDWGNWKTYAGLCALTAAMVLAN